MPKSDTQLSFFPEQVSKKKDRKHSTTFLKNMQLPVHKWFRYSAGFSAQWVSELIEQFEGPEAPKIIDPFAGSGTVQLECDFLGYPSFGVEAHPFVNRIANAKLYWKVNPEEFLAVANQVLADARAALPEASIDYPELIKKCYSDDNLRELDALKQAWLSNCSTDTSPYSELTWLLITSILRPSSSAGTAQWQYVLPNKTKRNVKDPFGAYELKLQEMVHDMASAQVDFGSGADVRILAEDARAIQSIPENWGNLIITSPPYANNYDYADATRLEMTFWGEITGWGDLQDKVRKYLVRACTQHVAGLKDRAEEILENDLLAPIRPELLPIFKQLAEERLTRGGKKNYHLMIIAYFKDLAQIFHELRRVTQNGNTSMCWVIGDSAPYGVYVPVDKFLGELAMSAGFSSFSFEKIRDRNIKWKNRKHRVPLKEGRLWIKG